jgi:uncharacterized protein (DUF885 family)
MMFRARRLVADTGIHARHWTRQQAIDYGIDPTETERTRDFTGTGIDVLNLRCY